jgi:hypothetical protein
VRARIDINKLNSGKIQLALFRRHQSSGFVVDFQSATEARTALIAFGIDQVRIEGTLELLDEIGAKEVLHFPEQELNDDALRASGFRI